MLVFCIGFKYFLLIVIPFVLLVKMVMMRKLMTKVLISC